MGFLVKTLIFFSAILFVQPGVSAQDAWANQSCVIPIAQTSSACGVTTLQASAEIQIYLKLQRQDSLCSPCTTTPSSISATLGSTNFDNSISACTNGLCILFFLNVETAGDLTLDVQISGDRVSGSPYTVTVDPADNGLQLASTTALGGANLTGGAVDSSLSFTLTLQDRYSNELSTTSFTCSTFDLSISYLGTASPPSPISPTCSFVGGSTFSFTYSSTVSGSWQIFVQTTDPVNNPFTTTQDVTLTPLDVNLAASSVTVITEPLAGADAVLEVVARDVYSNQLTSSGVAWALSVASFSALDGGANQTQGLTSSAFAHESEGLYSATFSATRAGRYVVSVTAAGMAGSLPSSLTVSPNRFSAANMGVEGTLANISAGSVASLVVRGIDEFGNAHSAGAVSLAATVQTNASGGSRVVATASVAAGTDGSSTLSFSVTRAGDYALFVSLTGSGEFTGAVTAVGSSPFAVSVSAEESQTLSSVSLAASSVAVTAGTASTSQLREVDAYGNLRALSRETFSLALVGPYTAAVEAADVGGGRYSITFAPTVSGSYTLQVTTDAATFAAPDFQVDVTAAGPAAAATLREDFGAYQGGETSGSVNVTNRFAVKAVDAFGNRVSVGGAAGSFELVLAYCTDPMAACVGEPGQQSGTVEAVQVVDLGGGHYGMEYRSAEAGFLEASVLLEGQHIFGSPWSVSVYAGTTDSAASFAFGLGAPSCSDVIIAASVSDVMLCSVASEAAPTTFDVRLVDVFGNERQSYGSEDVVVFSVASGLTFYNPTAVQNLSLSLTPGDPEISQQFDNGLHLITFTATVSAFYSASIQHGEVGGCSPSCNLEDIANTPARAFVKPAAAFAPHSYAQGDGLSVATAGRVSSFLIYTRDAFMNDRFGVVSAVGLEDGWSLSLVGPGGHQVAGTVTGQPDGVFNASFEATIAGSYALSVLLNGEELGSSIAVTGSPFAVTVYPSPASPASYIVGQSPFEGRVAISPATVRIQAVDEFGNERSLGTDIFQASVPALNRTEIIQVDNGDGTHDLQFFVTKSGSFQSEITVQGVQLSGSPFQIDMFSGLPVPAQSQVVPLTVGTAGVEVKWMLTARDVFYNHRAVGGDPFTLSCSNERDGGVGQLVDYGNGTYTGVCLLTRSGAYQVSLQGWDANVSGFRDVHASPFSLEIEPNVADPSSSGVYGTQLSLATAGGWATFYIFPRDRFLNPNTGTGGANFELSMKRVLPDNSTEAVAGCPFQSPSLPWGDITQPPTGVNIGPSSNGTCASVDTENGTFAMSYMATVAGAYSMLVNIVTAQGLIPTSDGEFPMTLKPSVADTAASFSFGAALSLGTVGEAMTFRIQTRDRFQNTRTSRGGAFNLTVTGLGVTAGGSASVRDMEDGTHLATYTATLSAEYQLAVAYGGVSASNSPTNTTLRPAYPDPTQFVVSGPGLQGGTVDEEYWVAVLSKDRFGNVKTEGGSDMQIELDGGWTSAADGTTVAAASVPGRSQDLADGRYNLTYVVTRSGAFQMSVRSVDPVSSTYQHAVGSPFLAAFVAAEISAAESTGFAYFDGSPVILADANQNVATAGKDDGFLILAKDAFGNPRTSGGRVESFSVWMRWESALVGIAMPVPDVTPNSSCTVQYTGGDSGQYQVTYSATVSGVYLVTMSLDDEHLTPHRVQVFPSRIDPGMCVASFPAVDDHGAVAYRYTTGGAPSTFTVLTRDLFNNPVFTGGDRFFVNVSAADVADRNGDVYFAGSTQAQASSDSALCDSAACVVDNQDGSYTVAINPTISGRYSVAVFLGPDPICQSRCSEPLQSPYAFETVPSQMYGALSVAYGDGLTGGQAGFDLTFTIQARDAYGNNRTHGRWNGVSGFGGEFFRSTLRVQGPLLNANLCACNAGVCIGCDALDCASVLADNRCSPLPSPYPIVADLRDGTYTARYALTQAADYTIAIVATDGLHVVDSPFSAVIDPGPTDPASCTTVGDGLYRAVAGEVAVGRVQAQDAFGNYRRVGGDAIEIVAQHSEGRVCTRERPDGACVTCSADDADCLFLLVEAGDTKPLAVRGNLTDLGTGAYEVAHVATVAGFYQLRLKINGTSLGTNTPFRSPFPLQVVPNILDPTASTVDGEGVSLATVFKNSHFSLWPRDRYGNSLATAKDPVYIQLCTSSQQADCAQRAGFAYVRLYVYNYDTKLVYPVKEKYSRASIDPGVNTGQPIVTEVRPNRDGSTTVTYAMETLGKYQVSVDVLDDSANAVFVPIRGSPFNLTVYPDDPVPFPPQCEVSEGQTVVAGGVGRGIVTLRNQYGITLVDSARKDMMEMSPILGNPSEVVLTISDRRDGTFDLNFQLTTAGQYYLAVSSVDASGIFGGVSGSPFSIVVTPSETDPRSCIAFLSQESIATAGDAFSFTIQTRDEFGNDQVVDAAGPADAYLAVATRIGAADAPVLARVTRATPLETRFIASFTDEEGVAQITVSGQYELLVTNRRTRVVNSPHVLPVEPAHIDAARSVVDATRISVTTAGTVSHVRIQARDRFDNPRTNSDGSDFVLLKNLTHSPAGFFAYSTQYVLDGVTEASFENRIAGAYRIHLKLAGTDILNSPFSTVVIPTRAAAASSYNQTAVPDTGLAGTLFSFVIQAADEFGNDHTTGGESFAVTLKGDVYMRTNVRGVLCTSVQAESTCIKVTDRLNGRYLVEFVPTRTGDYFLEAMLLTQDGTWQQIGEPGTHSASPWRRCYPCQSFFEGRTCERCRTLIVTPNVVAVESSTVGGTGSLRFVAGAQTAFTFFARDLYGNLLSTGGTEVSVRILQSTSTTALNTTVTDLCPEDATKCGQYSVQYMSTAAGPYAVSIRVFGELRSMPSILGLPAVSADPAASGLPWLPYTPPLCEEFGCTGLKCCLTGEGSSFATTAQETTFVVQTRDKYGNDMTSGGAALSVEITGPTFSVGTVEDMGTGQYVAKFKALVAGVYSISVRLRGIHIGLMYDSCKDPTVQCFESSPSPQLQVTDPGTGLEGLVISGLPATLEAGVTANVAIDAADLTAQRKLSQNALEALFVPSAVGETRATELNLEVVGFNDGEDYTIPITTTVATTWELWLTSGSFIHLVGSPFALEVTAAALSLADTIVTDTSQQTSLTEVNAQLGVEVTMYVITRDAFQNSRQNLATNDVIRWKLWHQDEAEPQVETLSQRARGDFEGQYAIPHLPDRTGAHSIRVTISRSILDAALVPDLFVRTVAAPVELANTVAYGAGLAVGTAGEGVTFTLEARDMYKSIIRSGEVRFAVQLSETSTSLVAFPDQNADGTYLFDYVVTKAATYRVMASLDLTWASALTLGEVQIVPAQASGAGTRAVSGLEWMLGEGLLDSRTAEQVECQVQLHDRFGNSIDQSLPLSEIDVEVSGDTPTIARVEARYCTTPDVELSSCRSSAWHDFDGTYRILYAATRAGQYRVAISVQGEAIDGSPWSRVVSPGPADVSTSVVAGAGLFGATAGVDGYLSVTARDTFGNPVEESSAVNITLGGPATGSAATSSVAMGEYEAVYSLTRSGHYQMFIEINSIPVPNSPFSLDVLPSDTDYRTCLASGSGLSAAIAGDAASFTIQARDRFGNQRTTGGDLFRITLSGPTLTTGTVQDLNNGTYLATFQLDLAGSYVVAAAVGFDQFLYIPQLVCAPAQVSGDATQLQRRIASEVVAGTELTFVAQARDRFGSKITDCQFSLELDVKSDSTESGRAISFVTNSSYQCENGLITGTIPRTVLTQTGQYQLAVLIGAQNVFDSPFTSVVRSAIADPGQSFGYGVTQTIAGTPQTFWIESRDAYGNMVLSNPFVQAEEFQALLQLSGLACHDDGTPAEPGAVCSLATVTDLRNSTFAASFTLTKSGRYEVVARLLFGTGLALIKDTPATLWVLPADLEPSRSIAAGHPRNVTAEALTTFLLYSRDRFDNIVVDSLSKFESYAVRRGEDTGELESITYSATIVYQQDGEYEVAFFLTTAAQYRVVLLADGIQLLNSPLAMDVIPGALVVTESTLSGGGVDGGIIGFPATFTIHARDSNGNQLLTGGAPWRVKVFTPSDLSQGSEQASLQPLHVDNEDGTYSVTYTSSETGRHLMTVEGFVALDLVTVRGGVRDYVFFVVDDEYSVPGRSIAHGPGVYGGFVGDSVSLTVQIRNELGLNRPSSGLILSAGFALLADTASTLEQLTPVDNNDGTYTVSYLSRLAGEYELTLKLSGDHILGSPFVVQLVPGPTFIDACTVTLQVTSSVVAAVVSLTIQARDEFWNEQRSDLFRGSDPFSATFYSQSGLSDFDARIYDNEDGTYTASYVTTVAGAYTLVVRLAAQRVGPSVEVSVTPGPTINDNCLVSGSGVSAMLAGQAGMVYVVARDLYGNVVLHGREVFNVTMLSAGGSLVWLGNARHCDDSCFTAADCPCPELQLGQYALSYSIQEVGEYLVSVRRDGGLLPGSPSVVTVSESFVVTAKTTVAGCAEQCRAQLAACDPFQVACECACSVLTPMLAGSPFSLTIESRDTFGNRVLEGRKAFVVAMSKATPPGRIGCFASEGCEPARVQGRVTDKLDGSYEVVLDPAVPGDYVLAVTRSAQHVEGSPFRLRVVPGTASAAPDGSRFSISPLATAGVEKSLAVAARDVFGNELSSGGDQFSVNLVGVDGDTADAAITTRVQDDQDGTYFATLRTQTAGLFTLSVLLDGAEIYPGVVQVAVLPAQVDPSNCLVLGTGLESPQPAGDGSVDVRYLTPEITVIPRDAFGNVYNFDGLDIEVASQGLDGLAVSVSRTTRDVSYARYVACGAGCGEYRFANPLTVAGRYNLAVNLQTRDISGAVTSSSPLLPGPLDFLVNAASVSSANCEVSGDGAASCDADNECTFTIQAKDAFGNVVDQKGDVFLVALTHRTATLEGVFFLGHVTDMLDDAGRVLAGQYQARYRATHSGGYSLSVSRYGVHVRGSPRGVTVLPGAPHPPSFAVEGYGAIGGVVSTQLRFEVVAKDVYGNVVSEPNVKRDLAVVVRPDVEVEIVSLREGRYRFVYTPAVVATYKMNVTVFGSLLASPLEITVANTDTVVDYRFCSVDDQTPLSTTVATLNSFSITPRTFGGQRVSNQGALYEVAIGDVLCAACSAIPVTTASTSVLRCCVDPTVDPPVVTFTSGTSGVFSTRIALVRGDLVDNPPIYGSPFTVAVHPEATNAASSVLVSLTAASVAQTTAGYPNQVLLIPRDLYGNDQIYLVSSSPTVTAEMAGPRNVTVNVRDLADGSFQLLYSVTGTGTYTLSVSIFADAIRGSPFTVRVAGDALFVPVSTAVFSTWRAVGETADGIALEGRAGTASTVGVQARDAYGNALTADVSFFSAQISQGFPIVRALAFSQADGQYSVTHTLTAAGSYSLSIFEVVSSCAGAADCAGVLGSPFTLEVLPGEVDPSRCRAYGPGSYFAVANVETEVNVLVRDAFGNNAVRPEHAQRFSVRLTSQAVAAQGLHRFDLNGDVAVTVDGVGATVTGDGVTLAFRALMPGRYELTILYNATVIGGTSGRVCGISKPCPVVGTATPPRPVSTQFSNSGGRILIAFESATNAANSSGRFDCSLLFSADTVATLSQTPGEASCLFLTPSLLDMALGFGASVQVNDDLFWRPQVLQLKPVCMPGTAVCFAHSQTIDGASRVSRPDTPVAPVAVIKAPASIGPCDSLVLDASSSYGSAGRQVSYYFGLQAGSSNDKQVRTRLFGQMREPYHASSVALPPSILRPGERYTFLVRVTNFLDASSVDAVTVTRTEDNGPLLFIEGPNTVTVRASQPFKLRASAALSACQSGPSDEVAYAWTVAEASPGDAPHTVALNEQTRATRTLYVAANSLVPGSSYVFSVTGHMVWNASHAGSSTVTVNCEFAPLIATISGGNRAVWAGAAFELDATGSIDLDGAAAVGDFRYEWSCVNGAGGACFSDANGVLDDSGGVLRVDGGLLATGTYRFTVTVLKEPGPRSASASATMYLVPAATDPVQIAPLAQRKVNANERLVLRGLASNASCTLGWSQLAGSAALVYPELVSTRLDLESVALRPNVLLPGATYRFRLASSGCGSGLEGFAELSVVVNTAPSSGQFAVQPTRGYAAVDVFGLVLQNWVDDAEDLPFTYEFRYAAPTAPAEHIPLGTVDSNWLDVHLPAPAPPDHDEHNVTLLASVIDSLQGRATSVAAVTVMRLPSSNGTFVGSGRRLQEFSSGMLDRFVATGNVEGIVQMTISLASQEALECALREKMVSDLAAAAASLVMNAAEVAGFAAALRSAMAGPCLVNATVGARRLLAASATSGALAVTQTLVGNSMAAGLDPTAEQGMGDTLSSSLGNIAGKNTARRTLRRLLGHADQPGFARGAPRGGGRRAGDDEGEVLMSTLAGLGASQLSGAVVGEDAAGLETEAIAMRVRQQPAAALNGAALAAGSASFETPEGMLAGDAPLSAQTASLAVSPFDSPEAVGEVATLTLGVPLSQLAQPVRLSVPVPRALANASKPRFLCVRPAAPALDAAAFDALARCAASCEGGTCVELPGLACEGDLWAACQWEDVDTCRFWNGDGWDGEGCVATGLAGQMLECECFHLTDFGGATSSAIPRMNFVDPTNPGAVFANLSPSKILIIAIVCGMLLSYFALCYWGWRQDRRDNEEFAAGPQGAAKYEVGREGGEEAVLDGGNYRLLKRAMQGKLTRSLLVVKSRALKLFKTEHKLFGAFWAKRSYYTRPRRFTVLFCMVIGNMFVIALFVGQEGTSFVQKVVAGFISALLMLPATIFFKKVFMSLSVDPQTKARWDAHASAQAKAKQADLAASLSAGPTAAGISAPPADLRPDGFRPNLARGHIPHPDRDRMGVAAAPRVGFIGQFKRRLRVGNNPAPTAPTPPQQPQPQPQPDGATGSGGGEEAAALLSPSEVGGYIPRRALPLKPRPHAPAPLVVERSSQASSSDATVPFGEDEEAVVIGERQEVAAEHEVHTKREGRVLTGRARLEATVAKAVVHRLVQPPTPATKAAKTVRIPWRFQYAAYTLAFVWYMLCCYFCILYGVSFSSEIEAAWLIAVAVSLLQDLLVQESLLVSARMSARMVLLPNIAAWIAGKIADRYQ